MLTTTLRALFPKEPARRASFSLCTNTQPAAGLTEVRTPAGTAALPGLTQATTSQQVTMKRQPDRSHVDVRCTNHR